MMTILTRFSARIATLILLVIPAQLAFANDDRSPERFSVYAKVILRVPSPGDKSQPIVESWIANKLNDCEESGLRAVTDWVRLVDLGDGQEGKATHVWNATVDGKGWGCPVCGSFVECEDGKVKVELAGWGLYPPKVKGKTLSAEIGSRRIAVVDCGWVDKDGKVDQSGIAYVALFVGPATSAAKQPLKDSTSSLGPDITEIVKSYRDLKLMTPEAVFVNPETAYRCAGPSKEMIDKARLEKGPHADSAVKIFMNQLASKAFNDREAYPVGSIVVKEKMRLGLHDKTNTEGRRAENEIGGMVKRPAGFDESNGNWEYFYKENGSDIDIGKIASCIQCHAKAKESDYIFGSWAKSDKDRDPYGLFKTPKHEPQIQEEPYDGRCESPVPPEGLAALLDEVIEDKSGHLALTLVRHPKPSTQPATARTAWVCMVDGKLLWVVNNELENSHDSEKAKSGITSRALLTARKFVAAQEEFKGKERLKGSQPARETLLPSYQAKHFGLQITEIKLLDRKKERWAITVEPIVQSLGGEVWIEVEGNTASAEFGK